MCNPVPRGIVCQGTTLDRVSVYAAELEQETEASFCDDRMCGLKRDVVSGDGSSRRHNAVRHQELPERKVRKLNYAGPGDLHGGDQA